MDKQKQVLIVTNAITEDEVAQIKKAFSQQSTQNKDIKLSLVHVIPRLPTCYFSIPSMSIFVEKCYDEAKETLSQIGKHLGIAKRDQWLITGKIRTEALSLASKLGSSFILASSQEIKELQRSLFFKNIHQYALIKAVNQIEKI